MALMYIVSRKCDARSVGTGARQAPDFDNIRQKCSRESWQLKYFTFSVFQVT